MKNDTVLSEIIKYLRYTMSSAEINIEKEYSSIASSKEQPFKDATYSQLTRCLDERIQLRVIKSVVSANCDTVKEKEIAINEESRELDSLFNEVWTAEDNYCNRIWSFASQHDFHTILDQQKITEPIKHKCPYNSSFQTENIYTGADVDKDTAVLELTSNIGHLRREIFEVSCDLSTKREIEKSLEKLAQLQTYSEEISVVLRLLDEHAKKERERKKRQNISDVLNSTFISAKKLAKCSNYYPRVVLQRENVSRIMKSATDKISLNETEISECVNKFTVKKQSEIALKFEKQRDAAMLL